MSVVTTKVPFWRSPSGRIHWLRSCSGGGGRLTMRRVHLTRAQFDAAVKCKCTTVINPERWTR